MTKILGECVIHVLDDVVACLAKWRVRTIPEAGCWSRCFRRKWGRRATNGRLAGRPRSIRTLHGGPLLRPRLRLPLLGRLRRWLLLPTTGLPQELFDLPLKLDANVGRWLAGHRTAWRAHRRRRGRTTAPGHAAHNVHDLRDDPKDDEQERQQAFDPVETGGEEWSGGLHGNAAPNEGHWPPATAGIGPVAMLRRMSVSACRLRSL